MLEEKDVCYWPSETIFYRNIELNAADKSYLIGKKQYHDQLIGMVFENNQRLKRIEEKLNG